MAATSADLRHKVTIYIQNHRKKTKKKTKKQSKKKKPQKLIKGNLTGCSTEIKYIDTHTIKKNNDLILHYLTLQK